MKILKGLLSLLLCICLIMPMGASIVAQSGDGSAKIGATGSDDTTPAPSEAPTPDGTEIPGETSDSPAPCDYSALYTALMEAETFAEAQALIEGLTDEQLDAFLASLTDDEYAALEAHINELIAVAEDNGDIEYVYQTVNFTNVAPLLDPVSGSSSFGASLFGGDAESSGDEGGGTGTDGMVMLKNAVNNGDGTYTITLEAYATGESLINRTDVPTDIILVLDQSGSMKESFTTGYSYISYSGKTNSTYYDNRSNLYYQLSDGTYEKVTVTRSWNNQNRTYTYTYTWNGGSETSTGRFIVPNINTNLYLRSTTTITRLEAIQNAVTAFADEVANKAKGTDGVFGTDDDVNHRIAVVGFASSSGNGNNTELLSIAGTNSSYTDENGQTVSVGKVYSPDLSQQDYMDVLQNMNTSEGQTMVSNAINALDANGGTMVNYGLTMANSILAANSVPENASRNRVVIVFTDGAPGNYGDWESQSQTTANSALDAAHTTKNTYNATVYTVGIFSGANGETPASLPDYSTNNLTDEKKTANSNRFMHLLSSNYPDATAMNTPGTVNPNLNGKSYYLSAGDTAALNEIFERINQQIGGTEVTLNEESIIRDVVAQAFELSPLPEGQEDNRITLETYACTGYANNEYVFAVEPTAYPGTLSAELTTDENGKQRIDVTGFSFKDNWVGTVENEDGTTSYRGQKLVISFNVVPKDGFLGGNDVFTNEYAKIYPNRNDAASDVNGIAFNRPTVNVPIVDPTFTVNDKTIYEGNSTAVSGLYTHTDYTGDNAWKAAFVDITYSVYQNSSEVSDENVSPADCTGYTVTVTYKPKYDGVGSSGTPNEMSPGKSTKKIATVHVLHPVVSATVNDVRKYYGERYALGDGVNGTISVDWLDSHSDHTGTTEAEGNEPYTASDLELVYSCGGFNGYVPDADFDVTVKVMKGTDEITGATITTNCDYGCEQHTNGTYRVHVLTCSLTITKALQGIYNPRDAGQSFIFTVKYDGIENGNGTVIIPSAVYKVVISGEDMINGKPSRTIVGLPVGSYTVSEDTDWSWRYEPTTAKTVRTAELSAATPNAAVTMTNRLKNEQWLGFETAAKNVFNSNGTPEYTPAPAVIPGKEGFVVEETD